MSDSAGPTPPAGQPRPVVRRAEASPFMQKKRRVPRAVPPTSGLRAPTSTNGTPRSFGNGVNAANTQQQQQQQPSYQEFPIVISKADLGRGMRFHAIKFKTKLGSDGVAEKINPYSETEFTRPLHLHRRYAQDKQQSGENGEQSGVDDKERELINAKRAERQAEREANQALIAPSGKRPVPKRKKNQKNIEDVYYNDNDPKQQKAAQLRYEETKPWHLEDFDGKNVWVAQYQEPLSEQSVLFQIIGNAFTMVPVERWYMMRRTDKVVQLTSEEVEKQMAKKYAPGRWFLNTQAENDAARKQLAAKRRVNDDDDNFKQNRAAADSYRADLDELDYEANDEFQDDDEGLIFGEDDETAKETEKKVREEMREANLPATNMKDDEADIDEEEDAEEQDQRAQRKIQKKLRKRIVKHEKRQEYDSDSDHEYSDSSDEDSDEEQQRLEEEQRKKDEAAKNQANGGRSGASTTGNNTPAGRSEKRDQSRLSAGNSLKRPGSPSLSEVSGSESRKKLKVNGRAFSSGSVLSDGARSPLGRSMAGYGSGSETEASRSGRPRNSRAVTTGSPHERSQPGSRAQSPGGRGETPPVKAITIAEIRAAIPPEGITVKDLGTLFKSRVSKDKTNEFIALVKAHTHQDPETKLLIPIKPPAGDA